MSTLPEQDAQGINEKSSSIHVSDAAHPNPRWSPTTA